MLLCNLLNHFIAFVQGIQRFSPNVCWDGLQPPATLWNEKLVHSGWLMDFIAQKSLFRDFNYAVCHSSCWDSFSSRLVFSVDSFSWHIMILKLFCFMSPLVFLHRLVKKNTMFIVTVVIVSQMDLCGLTGRRLIVLCKTQFSKPTGATHTYRQTNLILFGAFKSCQLSSLHHTVSFRRELSLKPNLSKNNLSEGIFSWMLGAFLGHEAPLGGHFGKKTSFSLFMSFEQWYVDTLPGKKNNSFFLTWKETLYAR